MCKKQTSVSHSSTESEIISLDTGLRLDGLLALELCDLPPSHNYSFDALQAYCFGINIKL